jgi:SAM-dependent methyltransferase
MEKKGKRNKLLDQVIKIFSSEKRGRALDLGCGSGDYSLGLRNLGFDVTASDMDVEGFRHSASIKFVPSDLNEKLPFANASFDYVLLAEVIEHVYNPLFIMNEISRVLKSGGSLILSTPNILNIESRFRFFFEGGFDFFREPTLDYARQFPIGLQNMHVIPWRYQELEYLLFGAGLKVVAAFADSVNAVLGIKFFSIFARPLLKLQAWSKERRSSKKGGVDFRRMNRLIFSDELFFGKHLIVKAVKG